GLAARLLQDGAVAQEIGHAELRQPRLTRAEELAGPAELEIHLGDLEPVIGLRHRREAPLAAAARRCRQEDAEALEGPPPHAAAELVELGEPEALGVLHEH